MRRREALLLYAVGPGLLITLLLAEIRTASEIVRALLVACATALACGALALPLLRPLLLQADHDATAAALLAASTLSVMGPVLALVASPTVRDAFRSEHLTMTLGSLLGLAVAMPSLARAWREVAQDEWKPIAFAALGFGGLLAAGQEVWFPLGVVVAQVVAFVTCVRLAWERDAVILPSA